VRCGVAVYGLDPFGRDPSDHGLLPAMELRTTICAVKPAAAGDSVGYGRKFVCEAPTVIATAPIGYADGVLRAVGEGRLRVISGSRLVPIVGAVSMDNITVDLGFGASEKVGDELVLIGRSGGLTVHAEDWARAARTINYEIVTGIRGRVERHWTQ
jgi:alanine racemase